MSNMENLLAQVIIESTKVDQSDLTLQRMTTNAVKANLHSQQNLVRFQQGRMNNLENDVNNLKSDIKNKNLEKKQLQEKLKIAVDMYEKANHNTGTWIELLNKPLHVIATRHEGFNKAYQEILFDFSKIMLENMVQHETIIFMGEDLEYGQLEIDIIKSKFEEKILKAAKNEAPENQTENQKLIVHFHDTLSENHTNDKKSLKKQIIQSGKNYKM